jgi:hypothetical protein
MLWHTAWNGALFGTGAARFGYRAIATLSSRMDVHATPAALLFHNNPTIMASCLCVIVGLPAARVD